MTPEDILKLLAENKNKIECYYDYSNYFIFENDKVRIVIRYLEVLEYVSVITIYKKTKTKTKHKSIFEKEEICLSKEKVLSWGEDDRLYPECWQSMSKILLDVKNQKINEGLAKEKESIEKKKRGHTSRMRKATLLMKGEK